MDSDMISRQALLDAINEEIEYGEEHSRPENEQVNKGLRIARKLVKASPTIEAEPVKHGRWEINCDGYYPYCSNCKNEPQGREMTLYCPNCGARMDLK